MQKNKGDFMNSTVKRLLTFFIGVPLVLAFVYFDFYNHLPTTLHNAGGEINKISSKMSFSAGIYLRINPSFLIKKFE